MSVAFAHDFQYEQYVQTVPKTLSEFFGQAYAGDYKGRVHFNVKHREDFLCVGICDNNQIMDHIAEITLRKEDTYVTANDFFFNKRQNEYVFSLHNIILDIDCHGKPVDEANRLADFFLGRLYRDLITYGEFPEPSLINKSGRGIQLWFTLEQAFRSMMGKYKYVSKGLVQKIQDLLVEYPEELEGLEIDAAASGRPCGLYRLPGSYNTVTGTYGQYAVLGGRFTLQELEAYLPPYVPKERSEIKITKPKKQKHTNIQIDEKHRNEHSLVNVKRMQLVEGLIQDRNRSAGKEMRDLLMFVYYNAAVQLMDRPEARRKLIELNQFFKFQKERYQNIVDYIDDHDCLFFKNETLIDWLYINAEEQDKYGIYPRTDRNEGRNKTRDEKRNADKYHRDSMIYSLAEQGLSVKMIALEVGCHRDTAAKVLGYTENKTKKKAELAAQIRKMKKRKMTQKEIAETLAIPLVTVRRMW